MLMIPDISIREFDYHLPDQKIAKYPLAERDQSSLLFFKDGILSKEKFSDIPELLPADAIIVFNQTRVIQARMEFIKSTGARLELFCLEPAGKQPDYQLAFSQTASVSWKCLVGNLKKWKSGKLSRQVFIQKQKLDLTAELIEKSGNTCVVRFEWEPAGYTFAAILDHLGKVPLPPYLKREPEAEDRLRYQTIYAKQEGSVAAPTAGLHFTERALEAIKKRNIKFANIILHVGAGTFQPVISNSVAGHSMHAEFVSVKRTVIEMLRNKSSGSLIAVGTTTTRALESLHWYGIKLMKDPKADFSIAQWEPYDEKSSQDISLNQSMDAILAFMDTHHLDEINGRTRMIIIPSYDFKVTDILITNFHQPRSTLLLLVAAFIGEAWGKAYDYAIANDFRFLSYGDSCLFYKKR